LQWFIRVCPIVCLGILVACDSPSVAFMNAQKTIVVIEESTFSVYRLENRVEVYRTSFEILPKRGQVFRRAELAIEQATGCPIWQRSLEGDQALITARLDCEENANSPEAIAANLHYECEIIDYWNSVAQEYVAEGIECDLVPW